MEKCPICGRYAVAFDEYYKRKICLMSDCGWSELSSEKKEIDTKMTVASLDSENIFTHI